jgi:hypothetical protein
VPLGEGRDRDPPARHEDARELRERQRAVDQMDDEAHDHPLEPGVLEGQLLGAPELQPDALPSG